MSHEASGYVERHSPYRGAAFAVHRSIGEIANDTHSYDVWMTLRNLAAKSRVSLGAAKAAVDRMVADGFLIVLEAPTYRLPGRYRFVFKDDAPVVWETHEDHRPRRPELAMHRSLAERCTVQPVNGALRAGLGTVQNTVQSGEHIKQTEFELKLEPKASPPTPSIEPQPRRKPKTLLSPDWQPSAQLLSWAVEKHPSVDAPGEVDGFRDFWLGLGEPRADWEACFRTRIRNAAKRTSTPGRAPPSRHYQEDDRSEERKMPRPWEVHQ